MKQNRLKACTSDVILNCKEKNYFLTFIISFIILTFNPLLASDSSIPEVYQGLKYQGNELIYINPIDRSVLKSKDYEALLTIQNLINPAVGTENGIKFDFKSPNLNGVLYFGLYQKISRNIQYPIYLNQSVLIKNGIAEINISNNLAKKYDIADWENDGLGKIGYRIVNESGKILYDGKINFSGKGPFTIKPYITEGPFVNAVTDSSVIISFKTNVVYSPSISINSKIYKSESNSINHKIEINGLKPAIKYPYEVLCGDFKESHYFNTNPPKGSRSPFKFAFSSDSRNGYGGGERDINGVNSYIMKKSAAFALFSGVSFFQFTGDMITGYLPSYDETMLQYANWKRTVEPYAAHIPFYVSMGNHESVVKNFDDGSTYGITINSFPFATNSSESAFIENFENFENGPVSEDNSKYDINLDKIDFPPYKNQVYHYSYANIAVIVLNSNYLYSSSQKSIDFIGGNLHGYIMDNQLAWLEKTIRAYEQDKDIDHIIVTIHTPPFPNGGHSHDGMWYNGSNTPRPSLFGKKVDKGIIERRDEFLDIICNKTSKVVALMTGDEHNYSRMMISSDMDMYPDDWDKHKISIKHPIWQIINGAAGAPYYGKEKLPWSPQVKAFTAEHIICLINVSGQSVSMDVYNPETLELFESVVLK